MLRLEHTYNSKKTALFCCLLFVFIMACAHISAQERQASLVIEPASGKAATAIKIKGAKFLPNEEVDIIMQVGVIYHGLGTRKTDVVVADKNGNFSVSSGIPRTAPPGIYKVEATGNKGSAASFNLEVLK